MLACWLLLKQNQTKAFKLHRGSSIKTELWSTSFQITDQFWVQAGDHYLWMKLVTMVDQIGKWWPGSIFRFHMKHVLSSLPLTDLALVPFSQEKTEASVLKWSKAMWSPPIAMGAPHGESWNISMTEKFLAPVVTRSSQLVLVKACDNQQPNKSTKYKIED